MSRCTDRNIRKMMAEYELELLSTEDREAFELHILSCDSCFEAVSGFVIESMHLIHSPELREIVQQAVVDQAATVVPSSLAEPRRSIRLWSIVSAATAAIIVFLVLNPWQIVFKSTDEALASEPRLAVLPITNLADISDSNRMGAAATQLLITDLADSRTVSIVSEKSIENILGLILPDEVSTEDYAVASSVAQQSNSRWVLLGKVISESPLLQIDVLLLDVDHQDTLASRQVSCETEDELFCVIDSITSTIRRNIQPLVGTVGRDRPVAEITTFSKEAFLYYVGGVDLYRQFFMDQAAAQFREAITLDSNFAMAWYYLGLATGDRSSVSNAMRNIDNVSRREQFWIRSRDALWGGDTSGWFQQLNQLVLEYPEEEEAYFWMGVVEQNRGDREAAEQHYLKALEINRLHERSYNQLSYLYADLGDYDRAIWAAQKHIDLVPDEPNPYDSRAEIYQCLCEIDSAISFYRRAIEIKPDFTPAVFKLANLLLLTGRAEEAESLYGGAGTPITELRTPYLVIDLSSTLVARGLLDSAVTYIDHQLQQVWSQCDSSDQASIAQLLMMQKAMILAETDAPLAARKMAEAFAPRGRTAENVQTTLFCHYVRLLMDAGDRFTIDSLMRQREVDYEGNDTERLNHQFLRGCLLLMDDTPDSAASVFEALWTSNDYAQNLAVADLLIRSCLQSDQAAKTIRLAHETLCFPSHERIRFPSMDIRIHYLLAQAYHASGQTRMAEGEYQLILDRWGEAGAAVPLVKDIQRRLEELDAR